MPSRFALTLYEVSTWIIPLIVAITFHEAAHGFVAYLFRRHTAWRQGRVSFNPLKHIDPFGTSSPASAADDHPLAVSVRLREARAGELPRAAPPETRFGVCRRRGAGDEFDARHFERRSLSSRPRWRRRKPRIGSAKISATRSSSMCCSRCSTSCPFLPLDGGRILVGLLPDGPSRSLAALEPYGMIILIAALLILPILGAQIGLDLNFLWRFVARLTDNIVGAILRATGAG